MQKLKGGIADRFRFVNLKAKVTAIGEVMVVGSFPDLKNKRDVTLADNTDHIHLVLWREKTEKIEFFFQKVVSLIINS